MSEDRYRLVIRAKDGHWEYRIGTLGYREMAMDLNCPTWDYAFEKGCKKLKEMNDAKRRDEKRNERYREPQRKSWWGRLFG